MFHFLLLALLPLACVHHFDSDAILRAKFVGTWTTGDLILPDGTPIREIVTVDRPDGSYLTQYKIVRNGELRAETTGGTWKITGGSFTETQTNVNGAPFAPQSDTSKILQLNSQQMILSNGYSPRRVFFRRE